MIVGGDLYIPSRERQMDVGCIEQRGLCKRNSIRRKGSSVDFDVIGGHFDRKATDRALLLSETLGRARGSHLRQGVVVENIDCAQGETRQGWGITCAVILELHLEGILRDNRAF